MPSDWQQIWDNAIDAHAAWQDRIVAIVDPTVGWATANLDVSHDRHGVGPIYAASLHYPQEYPIQGLWDEDYPDPISKAISRPATLDGPSRWLTLHLPDESQHPVKVVQGRGGKWMVVGGMAGRLNGMYLSGLKDELAYKHLKHHIERGGDVFDRSRMLQRRNDVATATQDQQVPIETHTLQLTPAQALAYTAIMHHHDRVQEGATPIDHHLRVLAGPEWDSSAPDRMQNQASRMASDRLRDVLDGEGAKPEWITDFINKHPGEAVVVIAPHSTLHDAMHDRLMDSNVRFHIAPGMDVDPVRHSQAMIDFAPPGGDDPRTDVLITSHPTPTGLRKHHLIIASGPDIPNSGNEVSVHRLSTAMDEAGVA